ncbi:MAG TPA: carbon storage regulator [Planctomycetaceae bacterium]|nr:carbon storage regulator [Planctomycetaceae bacterium]
MLVLSRKINEEIVIAENVRIKVAAIEGSRVRLVVSAPDDVRIRRVAAGEQPQLAECVTAALPPR